MLAAGVVFDLARTLKSGRAGIWLGGTAARERQPAPYWRYVYQGCAMLVSCLAVFLWAILWPNSVR